MKLDLSANRLTAIPNTIGQLTELTVLYLTDNRLETLPQEIVQLADLQLLYLHGNAENVGTHLAAALRADLDRLVLTAIIPDRARETAGGRGDQRQVADTMVTEWERFKADWEPSPPAPSSQP